MSKPLFAAGSVIIFLLLYYAATVLVSLTFIAYYLSHGFSQSRTMLLDILSDAQSYNIIILSFLLLISFYILFYKLKKRKVSELIQSEPVTPAAIVLAVFTGFSFYLSLKFCLSFFLGYVESFHVSISHIFYSKSLIKDLLTYSITALVILPILEEVAYRGILYGILKVRLELGWAIFIQSLVYALMYSEPYIVLYTFVLGIITGAVYHWHKSILLPIVIHLSFNAAALIVNVISINKLYDANDSLFFLINAVVLPLALLLLYILSTKLKRKPNISIVKKVQA